MKGKICKYVKTYFAKRSVFTFLALTLLVNNKRILFYIVLLIYLIYNNLNKLKHNLL